MTPADGGTGRERSLKLKLVLLIAALAAAATVGWRAWQAAALPTTVEIWRAFHDAPATPNPTDADTAFGMWMEDFPDLVLRVASWNISVARRTDAQPRSGAPLVVTDQARRHEGRAIILVEDEDLLLIAEPATTVAKLRFHLGD